MAEFTLDDLKKTVEEKYAPTVLDMGEAGKLTLQPAVRLGNEDTAKLSAVQRKFNTIQQSEEPVYVDEDGKERPSTEEEDAAYEAEMLAVRPKMLELLREMIRIPATSETHAEAFFQIAGEDLPTYLVLIEKYGKTSQLGEASASPSS